MLEQKLQLTQRDEERLTKWMKLYGPQETGYACLYRAEDIDLVRKFVTKEKFYLDLEETKLTDEFIHQIERKLNDHHDAGFEIDGKKVEFLDCSKALDLPTIQGLHLLCRHCIVAISLPRYMGVGNDTREARVYQQQLFNEFGTRADMNNAPEGSITRVNQSLKWIGIFPASFPTVTVVEMGVFNVLSGYTTGTLFNRIVFTQFPIAHTAGGTAFTVATLINFLPQTKYE